MLTGAALVASQFACSRPQTLLAAPGFPHASRLAAPPSGAAEALWSTDGLGQAKTSWATASTPNPRTLPTPLNPSVPITSAEREPLPTHEPVIASVIVGLP